MTDLTLPSSSLLADLRLHLVSGVGPRIQQALRERFGSADRIFEATPEELLDVSGVGPKVAAAILAARQGTYAEREWNRCQELGLRLLACNDPEYPPPLTEIHDPPGILYCRGGVEARDSLAVAIVGSRRCTVYGRQQAEKLAAGLATAGMTIVSGLARGIDAAAHRGALAAGGRTIAVLGTGLDRIYPPEHVELADQVAAHGALLAEAALDQPPVAGMFPQRNRIISGLSLGVIVVEMSRNSGALHTVRHALEQGREVFAVPGRIDSLASEGCHDIIRDGATLIRHADDVLSALGALASPVETSAGQTVRSVRELMLEPQEQQILQLVAVDPTSIDEICRGSGLETSRVLATLTVLEMRRVIRRLPGSQYCRVD